MLNTLRTAIYVAAVVAALPGVMIFIMSICFNLLSDGLRTAMDVRRHDVDASPIAGRDRGGPAQPLLDGRAAWSSISPCSGGLFGTRAAWCSAVDGVSFDVMKGETLGIVGEIRLRQVHDRAAAHAADRAGRGRASCSTASASAHGGITLRELRRQVQMVFQDSYASLNPRLTVEDSIAFGPRVHGMPRARRATRARTTCCAGWGSTRRASPAAIRTNCRAASASASTSPARWRSSRAW